MKHIAPILILLTITSCVTQRRCNDKFPPQVTVIDSTTTRIVTEYRDTTVYVQLPGDTAYQSITIRDSAGQIVSGRSELRTSLAYSAAWINSGRLQHVLQQNDTLLPVTVENAIRVTWERAERFYSRQEVKATPIWPKIINRAMLFILIGVVFIFLIRYWLTD
mgnify:CR=1 FL=1